MGAGLDRLAHGVLRRAGEGACSSRAVPRSARRGAFPRSERRLRPVSLLGTRGRSADASLVERAAQCHRGRRQRRAHLSRRGRRMKTKDVPRLTIGIEEEFQIVDGEGQLESNSETLLTAARGRYGDQIKREMMRSVVAAGTKICANISEAREEIVTL